MTSVDTSSFPEARKREHELNQRQREVLDLLVAGNTNGEIAELLGMTLDGAKWNVSEILTKLGLTTREEAAEYWRWRRGLRMRTSSLLRRMASVVPMKWAAGGAAAAVVAMVVLLPLAGSDDEVPPDSVEIRPFYMEVETFGDEAVNPELTLRWWYQDRDTFRVEMEGLDGGGTQISRQHLSDGANAYSLVQGDDPFANGWISVPLSPAPAASTIRASMFPPTLFGPWPRSAETIDDIIADLSMTGAQLRVFGDDMVLGRKTVVIEDYSELDPEGPRYWIDTERMMVMRYTFEPGTGYEVTRLDWDIEHPEGTFDFVPPSEYPNETSNPERFPALGIEGLRSSDMEQLDAPGFLRLKGKPRGARETGFVQILESGQTSSLVLYLRDDKGFVTLTQYRNPAGIPTLDGEYTVRGYRAQYGGVGPPVLRWFEPDLRLEMRSLADHTADELIAIAVSLELRD